MSEWAKVNPEKLLNILERAYNGEVVVPEFQRSFIWGRQQVEELLESVLSGYFIGNFLALDSYGERPFPPRLVEGVQEINPAATLKEPPKITYILDGQQRITAIFYALYTPPLPLKGSKSPYRFYIDVEKLLVRGAEDSIVGIQTKLESEIKKAEKFARDGRYLPFKLLVKQGDASQWLWSQQTYSKTPENKQKLQELINRIHEYPVPVISIDENIGVSAIVDTFERINRTGTRLSTFDLLVARLYPDVKLRDLWQSFEETACVALGMEIDKVKDIVEAEYVVKVVSLMRGKSCKKAALLELKAEKFKSDWDKATQSIIGALTRLKQVYGVTDLARYVPYHAMIVPLAAILTKIEEMGKKKTLYDKLDKWYWASVFSERYESSADTYSSGDYTDVSEWLAGAKTPDWMGKAVGLLNAETLDVSDTRSAIYRGVMDLIAFSGAKDFCTGQIPPLDVCEDDHIFPKSKYKGNPRVNSVLNRTVIAKTTNAMKLKGAKKPSEYLALFAKDLGSEEALKEILRTHLIDDKAYESMKHDDLDNFIEARQIVILNEVQGRVTNL